jgi:hypothetical protein
MIRADQMVTRAALPRHLMFRLWNWGGAVQWCLIRQCNQEQYVRRGAGRKKLSIRIGSLLHLHHTNNARIITLHVLALVK